MGKLLPEGRWAQASCTQVVQTQTPALATPLILLSVFRSKVIPLGGCKIAFLFRIETVGILFPYLSFFLLLVFRGRVSLAVLELTLRTRLPLNSDLPASASAGVKGMCHHAQPISRF